MNARSQFPLVALIIVAFGAASSEGGHEPKHEIYFDENSVTLQKGKQHFVDLVLYKELEEDAVVQIYFYDQGAYTNSSNGIIEHPKTILFKAHYNHTRAQAKGVSIVATGVGEVTLVLKTTSRELNELPNFNHTFVVVDVIHSEGLRIFNTILGWSYMVCWGCSYYPQVYLNFRRWSVAGLSVDYALLNNLAYFSYCVVMCSMYWNPNIRSIYLEEHPHTQVPVEVPDLASVIHNMAIIFLIGFQTAIMPRGGQKLTPVSYVCTAFFVLAPLLTLPFAIAGLLNWLSFVHVFSYIKIGISLVKYAPQAYMNWRRQSTAGYSSVNMTLDFSGSTLLVMQLVLLALNRSDIYSMIGNPAKFGVGFFSWIFTGIFMVQNFILYRRRPGYETIDAEENGNSSGKHAMSTSDYYSVQ